MDTPVYAGIDIGGTNIKIGLVDDRAQTLAYESIPTDQEHGPQSAAERSAEALSRLVETAGIKAADIVAVGLASPGPMDLKKGLLICSGNLPQWHNTPLPGQLTDVFGLRTNEFYDAAGTLTLGGEEIKGTVEHYEVLEPASAQVLARFTNLEGTPPAITVNRFGKGSAYYVATPAQPQIMRPLLRQLRAELGIAAGPKTPDGVFARAVDGRVLYVNTNNAPVDVAIDEEVFTAGLELAGGLRSPYPPGLVVGSVVDVERDANDVVQTAFLAPAAELDSFDLALVITDYDGGLPPVDQQPVPCGEDGVVPEGEVLCYTPAPSVKATEAP